VTLTRGGVSHARFLAPPQASLPEARQAEMGR
jgi:hypothetical protein